MIDRSKPAEEWVRVPNAHEPTIARETFEKVQARFKKTDRKWKQRVVGAVWTRIMADYGHVDAETPSFAISLYKEYRGQGIGSQLMVKMFELLKWQGYVNYENL